MFDTVLGYTGVHAHTRDGQPTSARLHTLAISVDGLTLPYSQSSFRVFRGTKPCQVLLDFAYPAIRLS